MRRFLRRSEILISLAVIGLFGVSLLIPATSNILSRGSLKGTVDSSSNLVFVAEVASSQPFGFLTQTAEAFVATVSESGDTRVKRITQGILGHLEQETFEGVGSKIQDMTLEVGGYIQLFQASFQDELWSGQIVSRVPQDTYTAFVFDVKSLITDNGRVVLAEFSIEDITDKAGAEEGESMATVRVDLEEKPPGEVVDLGPLQRFLSSTAAILTQFGIFLGYAVVLIVPLSVAAFGFALMVNRGLKPLWTKTISVFRPTPSASSDTAPESAKQ